MKQESGFAMADTLVAMIIASLFGVSLFAANDTMARATANANARLDATLLARSLLNEGLTNASGVRRVEGRTYRWQRSVDGDEPSRSSAAASLIEIEVTVAWAGYREPQNISLKSARFGRPDA